MSNKINNFSTALILLILILKLQRVYAKRLQKIQRNFLWGWGSDGRKIAWIKWENICKPKNEGGLGIRDKKKFNVSLLAK